MSTDNSGSTSPLSSIAPTTQTFPAGLPQDCPPRDARAGNHVFFVVHQSNPPSADDFRTAHANGRYINACPCERMSNSVMASEKDARHLIKAHPMRYKHVSRGNVLPNHGVWRSSPSRTHASHHSLWLYDGVVMHSIFTEVI